MNRTALKLKRKASTRRPGSLPGLVTRLMAGLDTICPACDGTGEITTRGMYDARFGVLSCYNCNGTGESKRPEATERTP